MQLWEVLLEVMMGLACVITVCILITFQTGSCKVASFDYCTLCNCSSYEKSGCKIPQGPIDFSCKHRQHLLCRFPSSHDVYPCRVSAFEWANARKLLNLFNGWRNDVALGKRKPLPPAADMMRLEWNDELVYYAMIAANQCAGYSDTTFVDYCRDSPSFPVAAYKSSGNTLSPKELVKSTVKWEEKAITPKLLTVTCDHIGKIFPGMFFQKIIWAKSRYLGCAYADRSSYTSRYMLVCYVGPAGEGSWLYQVNKGQKVYEEGKSAAKCPKGSKPDPQHSALCRASDFKELSPEVQDSGDSLTKHVPWRSQSVALVFLIFVLPFGFYVAQMLNA